jgi:hypothetical protein
MSYIITVNRAGYLPEQDPYEVETIEEARDAIRDEIDRTAEVTDLSEQQVAEAKARVGDNVDPNAPGFVDFGGFIHAFTPKGNLHPTPNGWRR